VFSAPVNRLITELNRLPGVGQRTAQRLAFHILRQSKEDALALADAIREVKETVGECEICFNLAVGPVCKVCEDPRRDPALICVVEEPSDIIPIERTHEFSGRYHVLGGALSPIDGVDPEDLRIFPPSANPTSARARPKSSSPHPKARPWPAIITPAAPKAHSTTSTPKRSSWTTAQPKSRSSRSI
jgi:recombination protein RecR